MLLAIDTSTTFTGVALYDDTGVLGESVWHSGRDHTVQLLPQLDMLLQHVQRTRHEIAAVGVALGPGSWSGLRVGMSTAKGLAVACDLPLVGIGTLDALAYQHQRAGVEVYPIIRLGRDRFATASFSMDEAWQRTGEPRNVTLDEICAEVQRATLFCGDLDGEVAPTLQERLGAHALFPTPAANLRRPGFLAELAWRRFRQGDTDDWALLEPIYLGHPVKTKK
jgi:tRNA threonylcarbamoyladenosine biosynthesis protein TsaB